MSNVVPMKINLDSLVDLAQRDDAGKQFDKEGKLYVHVPARPKDDDRERNYQECLCRLHGNLLFIFETSLAKVDRIIVLNNVEIKQGHELEFQLCNNHATLAKIENYYFVATSEQICQEWVDAILLASVHNRKMVKVYTEERQNNQEINDNQSWPLEINRSSITSTIIDNKINNCALHIACEGLQLWSQSPCTYVKLYVRNIYLDKDWTCLGRTEVVRSGDPIFSRCFALPIDKFSLQWFEFKFEVHSIVQLNCDDSVLASLVYTQLQRGSFQRRLPLKSLRKGNTIGFLCLSVIVPTNVKRSCSLSKIDDHYRRLARSKSSELCRMDSQPQLTSTALIEQLPADEPLLNHLNLDLFNKSIYRKFVFKVFCPNVYLHFEEVVSESRSTMFIPQLIMKLANEGEVGLVSEIEKFTEANPKINRTYTAALARLHSSLSNKLKEAQGSLIKYLESWSFRPSKHKKDDFLQTVPLNLHKHTFRVRADGRGEQIGTIFTVGAFTSHEIGFNKDNMLSLLQGDALLNDVWTLSKRLLRMIKWNQIISKQLHAISDYLQTEADDDGKRMATLRSMYDTILTLGGKLDKILTNEEVKRLYSQASQIELNYEEFEPLELMFLNIKACLLTIGDRIGQKLHRLDDFDSCNRKLKLAIDSLQKVILTCYLSHFAALDPREHQKLEKLRWRNISVISQALTSLIIFLMDRIARDDAYIKYIYQTKVVLVQQTSLLDCTNNEGEMLADTIYALSELNNSLSIIFRYDEHCAHISIPEIAFFGDKIELTFRLGRLPGDCAKGFTCRLLYLIFNVGIAMPANSVQSPWPNLQEDLNLKNFDNLHAYFNCNLRLRRQPRLLTKEEGDELSCLLAQLKSIIAHVNNEDNAKVVTIQLVEEIATRVNAIRITNCKSAKDRTGMDVTLEETRAAFKLLNISEHDEPALLQAMLDTLRREGVRLEVAYKNIGARKYAFGSYLAILPPIYKPPANTNQSNIET